MCKFYAILRKVDKSILRSIWSPWRNERVPRQHIGTGNSIEIPMQKRSVRMCGTRKRWWGAPGNRVPTGQRHGKLGETCNDNSKTVQTRASPTTQAFGPRTSSRGYTFEACISGRFKIVEGSRRSRVVVEVDVHVAT